ncbi:MAG: EAL domain-containing protein, partial [Gammaproteobacteria bacterium]|nr:EAL domain-containing protein [Gammaproteobacteria bacterium]
GIITKSEDVHLLIIDNVTESRAEMAVVARESLNIAILALLSSELALLFLLWNPLSRLRFMATVFPLLAEGKYEQVRDNIARNINEGDRFVDEIDLVNHAAYKLSYQLETLNNDVTHYTRSLAENMEKLAAERDFTNFLLQTAQVIIVTTDRLGHIVQTNKYATNLFVNKEGELEGKPFVETFVTASDHKKFMFSILNICAQKLKNYSNESSFYAHDGHLRNIAWVHSYLGEAPGSAPIMLSIGTDITERKEAEKRISWLANHDPLTGLYNRRYFNEMFENTLQQNLRYKRTGALLYLDLDNFKFVNDTLGHQVGDKLIKEVALALKRITRASDIISRIGGDEFAIVIQDIDEQGVTEFCEDLNRRINAVIRPIVTKQKVSTSIGIAMFPHHGKTVNQLLVNADIAMYQAKGNGKGGWHLFSEEEQAREKIQHHETWKDKIEHAIQCDLFVLYFQPIMNIASQRITHYEVLVRMLDSDGGILAPLPFISVAENSGLIHKIDMIVVEKTISVMNTLRRRGINVKLSINLSAFTFSDRKILPTLRKMLETSNINNSNIIFEITETAALQDIGAACDLIEELQKIGVGFAIDDFGVGFSSFYYIRELPVDYIKIDGSFIQELARNPDDQLIVKAMSEVAKGFGKKTIAEYVEDAAALDILRK